jgi:hypothetical protein
MLLRQNSGSRLPTILVDSALNVPEHQTTWRELNERIGSLNRTTCNLNNADHGSRRLKSPTSVGESAGGRVKTIRVAGFAPMTPRQTFSQLPESVRNVWMGKFQSSSCHIDWAEMNLWFLEARLEFEDGHRGVLITDGHHVALQDHNGMIWFLRLLPAV